MLKKKERLTTKQFDRFFSSGRRHHSPLLTLLKSNHDTFHGSVVVGKKVYKGAVQRNRLRRRLYSILYRLSREKDLQGVYIILTKPASITANFADLKEELEKLVYHSNLNPKP